MKKPKRREARYTLREIAQAWIAADYSNWLKNQPTHYQELLSELRRIAARKRKGKK